MAAIQINAYHEMVGFILFHIILGSIITVAIWGICKLADIKDEDDDKL